MQREPAPFRPLDLAKLIASLERKHEQQCATEKRLVAAGQFDARAMSFRQYRRRSVIHFLRELQATQNETKAATPPAGETAS